MSVTSSRGSRVHDRRAPERPLTRGWIYVVIAYLSCALVAWFWIATFPAPTSGGDGVNFFVGLLTVLAVILGIPAALLLLGALRRAGRTGMRHVAALLLGIAAVLPFVGAAVAIPIAQARINSEWRAVNYQASVSMIDRSGIVVMTHDSRSYANTRDRCSVGNGGGPGSCGPGNQPLCRSQSWLQGAGILAAHHCGDGLDRIVRPWTCRVRPSRNPHSATCGSIRSSAPDDPPRRMLSGIPSYDLVSDRAARPNRHTSNRFVLTVAFIGPVKPDNAPGDKHEKTDCGHENLRARPQPSHLLSEQTITARHVHIRNEVETRHRRNIEAIPIVFSAPLRRI